MSSPQVNSSGVPSTPFTLHGGCTCGAIKLTVTAPADSSRPLFCPAKDSNGQGDITSPMVTTCHCNDCRRATASAIPTFIVVPVAMASFSLSVRGPSLSEPARGEPHVHSYKDKEALAEVQRRDLAGGIALIPGASTADTFMGYHECKADTYRYFCIRCGTHFGYHMAAPPAGWDPSLEVLLGALERESLEAVRLSRQMWFEKGVEWVQKWVTEGDGGLHHHLGINAGTFLETKK